MLHRLLGAGLALLAGCIEPFAPDVVQASANYLVVDGSINSQGVSNIRLSRTQSLNQGGPPPPETQARIYIEEEGGQRYALAEGLAGTYTSAALALRPGTRVRLHLTTADQKEYVSEFAAARSTPPIDSVSWQAGSSGVQLYVNAHDDSRQSRYYRWSYEETWEFTSAANSVLEYQNGRLVDRKEDIYHCWASETSTTIKLGTTARLSQDVVSRQPLTLLPPTSGKLRFKYSILVKQYALTAEEYTYWELLRKNTEDIGTLFDPLPSELTGNIRCLTDAGEKVLGFVGVQSVTEKRLFITPEQLPGDWRFRTGYEGCYPLDTIPQFTTTPTSGPQPSPEQVIDFFRTGIAIPVNVLYKRGNPTPYYLYETVECIDCRRRGTNVRPRFWQ
ncbi:DUF4249 domain-containing protein [Hymenobacter sp. DG01]|uniref:DUF4249 domain-containing protein n=1 Tax=Hymenobacter sp. DG01 TaxID=2584940 RepID=UPI0015DE7C84|nr:DUF4249 domain-containing protein [Hymenobacter sp. DG01]